MSPRYVYSMPTVHTMNSLQDQTELLEDDSHLTKGKIINRMNVFIRGVTNTQDGECDMYHEYKVTNTTIYS